MIYFQHSMKLFGCVPPSLGNYELKVCTNGTSMSMREVNKLINCLKPCTMFKLQEVNVRYTSSPLDTEVTGLNSGTLSVSFKELITISKDQHYYTWLNFVAEFGGYVGLFLGYSVLQASDLIDKLIQKISGFF